MVRTCHTPRQPLQNHPSGRLGGWATPWSAGEMLDGQHQRVEIPAPAEKTGRWSLLTAQSVKGLNRTELNRRGVDFGEVYCRGMDFWEVYCRGMDFWEVNCRCVDFGEVYCGGVDFQEAEFPRQQAEVLFGKDFTVNQAFDLLDCDNDGQVTNNTLQHFSSLMYSTLPRHATTQLFRHVTPQHFSLVTFTTLHHNTLHH